MFYRESLYVYANPYGACDPFSKTAEVALSWSDSSRPISQFCAVNFWYFALIESSTVVFCLDGLSGLTKWRLRPQTGHTNYVRVVVNGVRQSDAWSVKWIELSEPIILHWTERELCAIPSRKRKIYMSIHSCRCNGCILSLWLLNRLLYQLWSGLFIVDFNRNPLFDMNFNWLTFVREKKPLFGEMYKFNVFLWWVFLKFCLSKSATKRNHFEFISLYFLIKC